MLWAADDQPRKAQVEPMSQDRFSEIHAPLFQPPKSNNAGALIANILARFARGPSACTIFPCEFCC